MRKLESYRRKYDPLLGPGAGEKLLRQLQREAGIASAIARTRRKARRLEAKGRSGGILPS